MAISDPKTYAQQPSAPKAEPTLAEVLGSMRDMIQVLAAAKTGPETDAALEQVKIMKGLIDKTLPENKQAPGISVYSHPEGELARPKERLRCKTIWCGRELTGDQETPLEIALLNQLEPGEFRVTKADSSSIPFKITAKRNDAGKLEEVAVWFPCNKEHRHNHMPMTSYLQQALGGQLPTVPEMMAELDRLKRELERAKAGVLSAV